MTKLDLSGRTPTVQRAPAFPWPRWPSRARPSAKPLARDPRVSDTAAPIPAPKSAVPPTTAAKVKPKSAPAPAAARPRTTPIGWLLREGLALLGMAGAALTVFSQLGWVIPLSIPFVGVLGWWTTLSSDFWLANYDSLGFYPHSHLQAAIALAVFLAMIGLGARISAIWTGTRLERRWGFLDGMTWPSVAIMGALAMVFLLAYDPSPSAATYEGAGGQETVKYLFAIILTAGYALGDYLGQRGFHIRLYRLAVLLLLLLGLNFWLLPSR